MSKEIGLNSKGYTLMEVTLFLAISSALALIAFIGLGPRLRNVRFTDAVRGVEASVVQAMSSDVSVVNTRNSEACVLGGPESTAGSSESCVLNGTAIIFDGNRSVKYRSVVSRREPRANCDTSELAGVLKCYDSRVLADNETSTNREYFFTNGLVRVTDKNSDTDVFVVLQNPENQDVYRFHAVPSFFPQGYLNRDGNFDPLDETQPNFDVCFRLDSRRAKLSFKNGESEPVVTFNEDCTP